MLFNFTRRGLDKQPVSSQMPHGLYSAAHGNENIQEWFLKVRSDFSVLCLLLTYLWHLNMNTHTHTHTHLINNLEKS